MEPPAEKRQKPREIRTAIHAGGLGITSYGMTHNTSGGQIQQTVFRQKEYVNIPTPAQQAGNPKSVQPFLVQQAMNL